MINTKILRFIRLNWATRTIKSRAFTRITATTLFAAAMTCLCASLTTPLHGVNNGQRINLGPENAAAPVTVTIWLKLHNEAALDALVQQLYDRNSPNYHHWLTMAQYKSQFAPTAGDVATARNFLAANNLKVFAADPGNHFIRAQGQIGDAQRAFNTRVDRVMVNGQIHRVAASEVAVAGPAANVVAEVQGLSDFGGYRTNVTPSKDPDTGQPYPGVSPDSAGSDGLFFSADCLRSPEVRTFTTNGGLPKATYKGTRYGADIGNPPPNLPSCGYDADEIQTAYGLKPLIQSGLDGSGQTIVIVDAFGSNTIVADANLFSQLNKLPPLKMSGPDANFAIVRPSGPTNCTAHNGCIAGNWQFETTLDVEWAHAVAPGAKIVLVESPDNSFGALDTANMFAVENQLGGVISNSFGIPEIVLVQFGPAELRIASRISKLAAAMGISQQVSTGDSGDNLAVDTADFGLPVTSPGADDNPFMTAVGGTSTFLNSQNQIKLQTGWGLNFCRIAEPKPNPPTIPPLLFGFQEGSGGGTSDFYHKPQFQNQLPGNRRKTPDIAMNADPETGNEIIVTPDSIRGHPQEVDVFGGTSLSAPMFSAVWAIANQAAAQNGQGLLGQAAPILYQLTGSAITDVDVPLFATLNNVTGTIFKVGGGMEKLPADALANPQEPTTKYVSALFHSAVSTRWDVFTFGTDSSLATGPGWDDVTGLGTPNGSDFIQAAVAAAQ